VLNLMGLTTHSRIEMCSGSRCLLLRSVKLISSFQVLHILVMAVKVNLLNL
jgi:hypothetical protein